MSRRQPSPTEPVTVSDRLRDLARRVERLAVGGRTDPETVCIEKQLISRALRQLARQTGFRS